MISANGSEAIHIQKEKKNKVKEIMKRSKSKCSELKIRKKIRAVKAGHMPNFAVLLSSSTYDNVIIIVSF